MAQVTWSNYSFELAAFAAEQFTPEKLVPGGSRLVASAFPLPDAQTLTLAAGAVVAGAAKTLTLTAALKADIPAGYTLDFGAGELFTLSAKGVKGATEIVGTLAADVEGGESATYAGISAVRPVEAGLLVGRTYTERDAGTGYGLADVATPDDEIFLIAFPLQDANINPDATLLRHGTLIYEDKLPNWATLTTQQKTAIRARYQCIKSVG